MHVNNPRIVVAAALVTSSPGILTREVAAFMRVGEMTARKALDAAMNAGLIRREYRFGSPGWPAVWFPGN